MDGWKEASIDIAGTEVKVAVVSGLGNARKLIEAIRRGEVFYHFVEVMACPGGCVGGGGQPIHEGKKWLRSALRISTSSIPTTSAVSPMRIRKY